MKKVLFILGYKMYPDITGGMEIFNYRMIEGLQDQLDVYYTCGRDLGFEKASCLRLRKLRPEKYLWPLQVFLHLLRHPELRSVVFSYSEASPVVWRLFTRMTRKLHLRSTVVLHFGNPHTGTSQKTLERFFKSAGTVIAVSPDIKRNYDAAFGLDCTVLPPAIPFKPSGKSREEIRSAWGIPSDAFVISMVGSLKGMKNPDTAIDCLSSLTEDERARVKPFLLYAGDGPMANQLKEKVAASGLSDRVLFLGRIPQEKVCDVFKGSDCYLIASDFEGTSLSLMEAMANGLPILASDAPGLRDMIEDGRNGLLFIRRDVSSLKQCILRYHSDPSLAASAGEQAREEYRRHYSFDAVAAQYRELL